MIMLKRGGIEVDIAPEIGASVMRFTFEGKNVFRPVPPGTAEVGPSCCFPLVPFANRIENGLLKFQGRDYPLKPNMGTHPHTIHGHGWLLAWKTLSQASDKLTLAYDHEPDEWPWAYSAQQTYTLEKNALRVRLAVTNRAKEAMPVSLGLHPYFPRLPNTVLKASVKGMWNCDERPLPTDHVDGAPLIDLAHGVRVSEAPFVDNCFTGWSGPVEIDQPDLGIKVTLTGSPECIVLHNYLPVGEAFFASEPVSAMPNAFNRPEPVSITGARALKPGKSFAIEMRVAVRKR